MNDLILLEKVNAVQVFSEGGMDPILKKIRDAVSGIVPDVTTDKGRKEIASLAHKVARSKTYLDALGKELKAEYMKKIKPIDAERKKMRDELDALKEEIRAPLTTYEEAEKQRVQSHRDRLDKLRVLGEVADEFGQLYSSEQLKLKLAILKAIKMGNEVWEEYAGAAAKVKDESAANLEMAIERQEKAEARERELARLKAEEEARKQKEYEERIKREAELKAKAEAERKIKEAEARAKAEKERLEKEKREAIEAEKRRGEAERQALIREQEAEKRAEAERKLREEEEQRTRETNVKHRKVIDEDILAALARLGIGQSKGKRLIKAINTNEFPHVRIEY